MKITRALISVSSKKGIAAFARELERRGVDIISTGGTAELLRKQKIPVREISSFTAFPEVLEGRVKTLHPRVHGGLLYQARKPETRSRSAGARLRADRSGGGESLSIRRNRRQTQCHFGGGDREYRHRWPSMIRSAAKNYESVTVVVDPADYGSVLENMRDNDGETTLKLREHLAIKAFIKRRNTIVRSVTS